MFVEHHKFIPSAPAVEKHAQAFGTMARKSRAHKGAQGRRVGKRTPKPAKSSASRLKPRCKTKTEPSLSQNGHNNHIDKEGT